MSLFGLIGKIALITGGAHGLGRMIAEGFLQAGCKVYITARKPDACDAALQELSVLGECVAIPADLSAPEGIDSVVRTFARCESELHILVNNAGKTWGASLESFPDKAWSSVMAVNVQAPFMLIRDLLPQLAAAGREDDPARVINVGSIAGNVIEPIEAYSYAASKAAIHHLSRVLAAELAKRHIAVNAVIPGYFDTQMTAHIRSNANQADALQSRIPLHRMGSADDIAGVCIFLASRAAAYITGAQIAVDGGLSGCR